jgi:uncharacterized cupin superfamily protein
MPTIRVGTEGVERIDTAPAEDRRIDGAPAQRIWNTYTDPSGKFSSGLWESEPGAWRVAYTEEECCHVYFGRMRIEGDDGSVAEYGAGDSFVVPAGFTGIWRVLETARKLYAIYERDA